MHVRLFTVKIFLESGDDKNFRLLSEFGDGVPSFILVMLTK